MDQFYSGRAPPPLPALMTADDNASATRSSQEPAQRRRSRLIFSGAVLRHREFTVAEAYAGRISPPTARHAKFTLSHACIGRSHKNLAIAAIRVEIG